MVEIKPCPWCGSKTVERNSDRWGHYWQCDCGAHGPHGDQPSAALEKWNARPIEMQCEQTIDQIEAELKALHTDVGRKLDAHLTSLPKDIVGGEAIRAKMKGVGKAIEIVQRVGRARP